MTTRTISSNDRLKSGAEKFFGKRSLKNEHVNSLSNKLVKNSDGEMFFCQMIALK
jgi:hypothetical protein